MFSARGRVVAVAVLVTAAAVVLGTVPVGAVKTFNLCVGSNPEGGTGCVATGNNVGLVGLNKKGGPNENDPLPAAAGLYGWGMTTDTDGSILTGDYWNYRIVHFEDNESDTLVGAASAGVDVSTFQGAGTLNVSGTQAGSFASSGTLVVNLGGDTVVQIQYTGIVGAPNAVTAFTGCQVLNNASGPLTTGDTVTSMAPTEASPYVWTTSRQGFGADTNQEPFGVCADDVAGTSNYGDVYMTEGSLYDVIEYNASGGWMTSWGTTNAANPAPFQYPSECTVGPNGYVYISNQWGTPNKALQGVVILDTQRYQATGKDGSTSTVVVGSTSTTTVSAADLNLTSSDVGAFFYGPGIPAGDTIASVISSTQATLTSPDTADTSNAAFIVGLTIESPPQTGFSFIQPRGLAFDSAGNLWVADQGHSRVDIFYAKNGQVNMELPPAAKYNKVVINNGVEIPPPLCSPSLPNCTNTTLTFDMRGLAIDPNTGLAFVANGQGCVVQEFNANPADIGNGSDPYGSFIGNFNGTPSGGTDCGTGPGQFEDGARGIAVDGEGNVWVGDLGNFRVQVFNEAGQVLWSVPAAPQPPPPGGFNGPRGVAFDSAGNMYVTDTYNYRIEEFSPSGTSGGQPTYTYNPTESWGQRGDGPGDFNYARLVCWDPDTPLTSGGTGALIVANTDSNMAVGWNVAVSPPVVVINPNAPNNAWETAKGTPPLGTLASPYGVACDPNTGDVYVANGAGGDVVVLDPSGNQLGTMTLTGDKLGFTQGIWVDSDGSVWVDSESHDTIYHFPSWASWQAGDTTVSTFNIDAALGVANGAAGTYGITGDAGYIYVALASTSEVAQLVREGAPTPGGGTCAETLCKVGTFGGRGVNVGQFMTPQGLAMGPDGNLYVVEEGNDRVSQYEVP